MTASDATWLSVYLYHPKPVDNFLIWTVRPALEEIWSKRLAQRFFFIRYLDKRGYHVRLRFQGQKDILEHDVMLSILDHFGAYYDNEFEQIKSQTEREDFIQVVPYQPEEDRYGGKMGVSIAEKQFHLSSTTVLDVMSSQAKWSYTRAIGTAIQLHIAFSSALGMDKRETQQFFDYHYKRWFSNDLLFDFRPVITDKEKEAQTIAMNAFETSFANQKDTIVNHHKTLWSALAAGHCFEQKWLNNWIQGMTDIKHHLYALEKELTSAFTQNRDGELKRKSLTLSKIWSILGSYVHMTNNRIGISIRDEAYINYLIKESFSCF